MADGGNPAERPRGAVKRSTEFLRSVLPADLTQLLFVFGVVCLSVASQLPWGLTFQNPPLFSLEGLVDLAPFAIQFAAAAGYFLCFRPGSRPLRRLFWWVCVPALAGLIVECGFHIYVAIGASAFRSGRISLYNIGAAFAVLAKLGPGFRYTLGGLALVAVFTWRAWLGFTSLPLTLRRSSICFSDDALSWRRLHIILWILLSSVWKLFAWFLGMVIFFPLLRAPIGFVGHLGFSDVVAVKTWLFYALLYAFGLVSFVGVAVWTGGKEAWTVLRRSVRLPLPESFLLAIAFPVGAVFLGSLGHYSFGLVQWAIDPSGKSGSPQFAAFFGLPTAGLVWSLLPVAFFEEVIFRGFLQPRFLGRYGLLRGLFLGNIVWGAWHFADDFSVWSSDRDVVIQLGLRLLLSVTMGTVLGWLTLRTASILPATLAHCLHNSFVNSSPTKWGPGHATLIDLAWGLLAYVLFRYWPVRAGAPQKSPSRGS